MLLWDGTGLCIFMKKLERALDDNFENGAASNLVEPVEDGLELHPLVPAQRVGRIRGASVPAVPPLQFYSEVLDPDHMSTDWSSADSGSGLLPNGSTFSNNFGSRGYIRNPAYAQAIDNSMAFFLTSLNSFPTPDTSCYNISLSTDNSGWNWNPTLFFGGPGGNGAGCN